jgi:hypothetical protein
MKQTSFTIQSGLKENWQQFALLVLVNAFVGAMIGLERSVLPGLGKNVFDLDANTWHLVSLKPSAITVYQNSANDLIANKF